MGSDFVTFDRFIVCGAVFLACRIPRSGVCRYERYDICMDHARNADDLKDGGTRA